MKYTYSGRYGRIRWEVSTFSSIPVQDYMMMVTDIVEGCFENGEYIPMNAYRAKVQAAMYYFTDCSSYSELWRLPACTNILKMILRDSNGAVKAAWADADREIERRVKANCISVPKAMRLNYTNWSVPDSSKGGRFLEWDWKFHRFGYLRDRCAYAQKNTFVWGGMS